MPEPMSKKRLTSEQVDRLIAMKNTSKTVTCERSSYGALTSLEKKLIAEVERLKRLVWLEPRNIPHCRFCGHLLREGHRCGSVYAEGGFDPSFGGVM